MKIKELFNAHGLITPDYFFEVNEKYHEADLIPWDCLFQINESVIIIFKDRVDALAESIGLNSEMSKEEIEMGVQLVAKAIGVASFYIDKSIYSLEGNWLLKNRNQVPNGLIQLFTLWLASKELEDDSLAVKVLYSYVEQYTPEVNLLQYQENKTEEMMEAFLKCLLNLINDVTELDSKMNNSSIINWDLWFLIKKSKTFRFGI